MANIYTKGGDNGQTSLLYGGRVPKHHAAVEAYGTVDELQSHLGLVRSLLDDAALDRELYRIQTDLFTVSAELASGLGAGEKLSRRVGEAEVRALEGLIDRYMEAYPFPRVFIVPGRTRAGAAAHVARTVCRRAERRAALLLDSEAPESFVLRYLNRLSDFLFAAAWALDLTDMAREALGLGESREAKR